MKKNQINKNRIKKKISSMSKISNDNNLMKNEETYLELKDNINKNNKEKKEPYPPDVSEIIAKILIEKIIAISIRDAKKEEIQPILLNYYSEYVTNQINTLLSLNYLFHIEEPENFDTFDYSKFWNTNYKKSNTWVELEEPISSKCDRNEGIFVRHIPLENNDKIPINDIRQNNDNESLYKENNNIKKEIIDKRTRNKRSIKNLNSELESLEEVGAESIDEDNISQKEKKQIQTNLPLNKSIKQKINGKISNTNIRQAISFDKTLTKRIKNEKIEFSSKEIPEINNEFNFDKYDPPNIEILRKEYEKQMEEKYMKNKLSSLKRYTLLNRVNIPKETIFNSDKLTFDPDGQIIEFKPINMNILVDDFKKINHKLGMIEPSGKLSLKRNSKIKGTKRNLKKKISSIIIKNPDDIDCDKIFFSRINPNKKTKTIQSGNNFSLMLPSVGVNIKDEEKVKKGSREFGKFFNKYSLEDFERILNDCLPKENQELVKNHLEKNKSISQLVKEKNNIMSLSMNNSGNNNNNNSFEFPNPLINQDNQDNEENQNNLNNEQYKRNSLNNNNIIIANSKNIDMNNSTSLMNNYNNSFFTNRSKKLNYFNTNLKGFIKLKNTSNSSLKLELDSLNDLEVKKQFFSPEKTNRKFENLFTKKYKFMFNKEKNKKDISKDMNDLNRRIISDVGWGNNTIRKNMSSQNILYSKHQNKNQLFKELGNSFINNFKLKLPRERKTKILD